MWEYEYDSEGNVIGKTWVSDATPSATPAYSGLEGTLGDQEGDFPFRGGNINYNPSDRYANTPYDPSQGTGQGLSFTYDPVTGKQTYYKADEVPSGYYNPGAVTSGGIGGIKGIGTGSAKKLLSGFVDSSGNLDLFKMLLGLAAAKSAFSERDRQAWARGYDKGIPTLTATRSVIPQPAYVPYSGKPVMGSQQLSDVKYAAEGGIMGLAAGGAAKPPRYLDGPTDGMADKINTDIDGQQPAKLSHGEFVIPADVVSHLGNGNSKAGANVLYSMMDRVRKARTGTKKQGKQINPAKFMPGGIAGYAGGGAVAFPDGGAVPGTGTTTPPTGSSTTSNLSEWAGPYVTDMLGKTQALANQPYQAYTGPLTAGYSPLQQQAFTGYSNLQTPDSIGQAAQTAGGVAGQMQGLKYGPVGTDFTAQAAQQYMNPYIQAALNPQLEELRRQNDISQMGQQAKFAQAGAFGGTRSGLAATEGLRNLGQLQAQVLGTGYANAYDKAMQQFNQDQARKVGEAQFGARFGLEGLQGALQAAQTQGNLGVQQGQLGLQGLAAQLGAGEQQRAIEQQGITAKQAEFEKQRLYPYQQLQFQQSMLQGLPISTYSNVPQTTGMQDISNFLRQVYGIGQADTGVQQPVAAT